MSEHDQLPIPDHDHLPVGSRAHRIRTPDEHGRPAADPGGRTDDNRPLRHGVAGQDPTRSERSR